MVSVPKSVQPFWDRFQASIAYDASPLFYEAFLAALVLSGQKRATAGLATGKWKLFRLMVDAAHQRRGYGQAALTELLARIEELPAGNEILVCYHAGNSVARALYQRSGFSELETDVDGRVTAVRTTRL